MGKDQVSHQRHFVVLDGLRGVAAIIIALLHARQSYVDLAPFFHAYLAVDFFFCLSGFVIAHAYGARLVGGMGFGEFLALRLIRLYPMILVGTLLGGGVYLGGNHFGLSEEILVLAATLILVPAGLMIGQQAYPLNNPIWSLFFEIGANAVYALSPSISVRVFNALAVVSAVALIITSVECGGLADLGYADWISFALGFVRVACPFVLGVGLCRFGLTERFAGRPAWVAIILLITVLFMPALSGGWYDALAVVLAFPLVITLATRSRLRYGAQALALLGRVSYPFYLIHQPAIRLLKHAPFFQGYAEQSPGLAMVTAVAIVLALSFFVVVVFDEPVRRILTRIWRTGASRSGRRLTLSGFSSEPVTLASDPPRAAF